MLNLNKTKNMNSDNFNFAENPSVMKKYLLILLIFNSTVVLCQHPVSIMQEELEYYNGLGIDAEAYDTINIPREINRERSGNCTLNKTVFGWHPYWMNGVEDNYQWNLISDLCYFSYEVDPNTGNALSTHGFSTNDAVDTALARGVKVHLCVTLFSSHATFFGNATARTNLINNLVNLIQTRGAHGINIDFEGVPSSQRANLTAFMIDLSNALNAANPNYELSICTYAVDWNDVFDEVALAPYIDYITIMGYDYYWSGSTQAGPGDPLYGFTSGYDRSLSRTITYYVDEGMPENKIVLGLPYYGREWETVSNSVPSNTTGGFVSSRTYAYVKDNASGNYTGGIYNQRSVSRLYAFQVSGNWRQCWITEGYEMRKRHDFVNQRNLKGIAIWALGYDDGYSDLWDAIEEKFTDCAIIPCTDTLYDGGGPLVDYYNDENYSYTIAPDNATQVTLDFQSFSTEVNFDTLWIYDGNSINAPLIGYYHGNASPGFITSTGDALTLRFKSDISTRAAGWMAVWNCITDNQPPVTLIQQLPEWVTQNTSIQFSDSDNQSIQYSFWNVADYNGTEWRSRSNHGFFTDHFDQNIHPEWFVNTGTWNSVNGRMVQSDESQNNTNIFASLNQDTANAYWYEWKGITTGTGNNKRSGFHFMCDDAIMDNRGNSYFVWFRLDDAKLQIYETINDFFHLRHEVPFSTVAGQEYLYQVMYDKTSGRIDIYVDSTYITGWTDNSPYQTGQHISFRSGNCQYSIDDLKVYALRTGNELITIGDSTAMIRYQNPNPFTPAGRISSIVLDESHLISNNCDSLINIDWTAPVTPFIIHDGWGTDEDTVVNANTFGGNWTPYTDPHSGISTKYFGIGTLPGWDNIIGFTAINDDSCSYSTSGFVPYATYYTAGFSINGAGLLSDTVVSDGFLYNQSSWGLENTTVNVRIYPNPTHDEIHIIQNEVIETLTVKDETGKVLWKETPNKQSYMISLKNLAAGIYFIEINHRYYRIVRL